MSGGGVLAAALQLLNVAVRTEDGAVPQSSREYRSLTGPGAAPHP